MNNLSDNICPKCSGRMFVNQDNDLNCLMCGKIVVLAQGESMIPEQAKLEIKRKILNVLVILIH